MTCEPGDRHCDRDGLPPKQGMPGMDSCPYDGVVFWDPNMYADYLIHRGAGVCPKCRRLAAEKLER